MEQTYYIFDGSKRAWMDTDAQWVKDDIEKMHIESVSSKTVPGDLARITAKMSEDTLLSYLDLAYSGRYGNFRKAVARWRVQLYKEQQTAIILADTFNVKVMCLAYDDEYIIEPFSKVSKQFSLRLDYGKWKYTAIPAKTDKVEIGNNTFNYKYDWTENNYDFSVKIPDIIVKKVMEFLQELAKEEFGFKPTVPDNMPGDKLLKYFVQYPLDVNVGWYVDMLGFDFSNKVVRKNESNFDLVCDYLQLPKSKGLKKVYHDNPEALIICYFLKEIGVDDINIWPHFYEGKQLMGVSLNLLGLDRNGGFYFKSNSYLLHKFWWDNSTPYEAKNLKEYIVRDKDKYNTRYVGWHLLYTWLLDKWGAQRTGEILSDVLLNIDYHKYDCLRLWLADYQDNDFPEEFVQEIYRNGISQEAHDLRNYLIRLEVNGLENAKYKHLLELEFTLTKGELAREDDTPQGSFKLPRTGKDMYAISDNMHNCVFRLYTPKMAQRACTIYYLQKDEDYLACIEVINGVVVQAYGKYNKILAGDVLEAVTDWCINHDLIYAAAK